MIVAITIAALIYAAGILICAVWEQRHFGTPEIMLAWVWPLIILIWLDERLSSRAKDQSQ